MSAKAMGVGIVGCGNISGIYWQTIGRMANVRVAACADIDRSRAEARASEYGAGRVCSVEELLRDEEVEIVLNLTVPKAHAEVGLAAVRAGKSVYNEKPLATDIAGGKQLMAAAAAAGVRVGCAPDTFLGAGLQTCRGLIDEGAIGEPVAATGFMFCRGHESWHPAPEFYYEEGGGPMLDMGPYYVTALVSLLGPVRRVTGSTRITFPERVITSEPQKGKVIRVETPTHVAGVLDFVNGAVGTIVTTFDTYPVGLPPITVYGSEGTLQVPDPNGFGGTVRYLRQGMSDWEQVPLRRAYEQNSRGVGVADMAAGIASGREHRASGAMALHVLEVMRSFQAASERGEHVTMATTCERPAAFPADLAEGEVD